MFNIDVTKLTELEKQVLDRLSDYSQKNAPPRIIEAAKICECSVSNVSKAIKKAGFRGYKAYINYLYYGDQPTRETIPEIERLKRILDEFDISLVHEFVELLSRHEKIVLFGYGPSFIAAQYFEYKLRFCTEGFVTTAPDENSLVNMVDGTTLLAIFSTTGQYRSFRELTQKAMERGAEVVVVSEEYNPHLMEDCGRYYVLSNHRQSDDLRPYEKTRTVFFIFFEQVIQTILADKVRRDLT